MSSILKKVNEVYKEKNPSLYLKDLRKKKILLENRKDFLLELKLPKKIFLNSTLIDIGSGSGQNTLGYDKLGSKCTLVEYDKKSCKKLFSLAMKGNNQAITIKARAQKINNRVVCFFIL